jgi:hypothetical protein
VAGGAGWATSWGVATASSKQVSSRNEATEERVSITERWYLVVLWGNYTKLLLIERQMELRAAPLPKAEKFCCPHDFLRRCQIINATQPQQQI